MSDAVTIDGREFTAYIAQLKKTQKERLAKSVIRSYVNNLAQATQELAKVNIVRVFGFKNPGTKKFLTTGIYVAYAKDSNDWNPQSEVGAVGNPKAVDYKQHRSEILARQEEGGKVTQIKSGKTRMRNALLAPDPRFNRNKFSPRMKNRVGLPLKGTRETDPKRIMAATLRHAKIKKLPYAITPYGVYRVNPGKVGGKTKITARRIQTLQKEIATKPAPWLMPAAKVAFHHREKFFRKAWNYRMSKAMGGSRNDLA